MVPWNTVFLTYCDPVIVISIEVNEWDERVPLDVCPLHQKWKALCHSEHLR